jgi:hypothetical protein
MHIQIDLHVRKKNYQEAFVVRPKVNKYTKHGHFSGDVFASLEKMEVAPSLDGNGSDTSRTIVPWFACSITFVRSYW